MCTWTLGDPSGTGPRIDRIPPTRRPWRRQYRDIKKLIFLTPNACPADVFGPVANLKDTQTNAWRSHQKQQNGSPALAFTILSPLSVQYTRPRVPACDTPRHAGDVCRHTCTFEHDDSAWRPRTRPRSQSSILSAATTTCSDREQERCSSARRRRVYADALHASTTLTELLERRVKPYAPVYAASSCFPLAPGRHTGVGGDASPDDVRVHDSDGQDAPHVQNVADGGDSPPPFELHLAVDRAKATPRACPQRQGVVVRVMDGDGAGSVTLRLTQ